MKLLQLRRHLEYLIFRLFTCLIGVMNTRQINWVADRMADVFVDILPRKISRYAIAEANVRLAFGHDLSDNDVKEVVRAMWNHLFRMVAELVQSPRFLHLENCRESIVFRGRDQILQALSTGRPMIVLSGHFGNWEISTATFGILGVPMGVIARKLDNPHLHNWFKAYREESGHQLILKKGGFDDLLEIISRNGCVGLLADQDAGPRGLFVDFFGEPASSFKSIALLAKEYNAIICVGYARRLPDDLVNSRWSRYEVGVNDIIDPRDYNSMDEIREITQRYTLALENAIRMSPEQYFWVHRRWKSRPKAKKSATDLTHSSKAA